MNTLISVLAFIGALTVGLGGIVVFLWLCSLAIARRVLRQRLREEAMKG